MSPIFGCQSGEKLKVLKCIAGFNAQLQKRTVFAGSVKTSIHAPLVDRGKKHSRLTVRHAGKIVLNPHSQIQSSNARSTVDKKHAPRCVRNCWLLGRSDIVCFFRFILFFTLFSFVEVGNGDAHVNFHKGDRGGRLSSSSSSALYCSFYCQSIVTALNVSAASPTGCSGLSRGT